MKLERKRQGVFIDRGFGFPVELRNVPMVLVRGSWTPDIDLDRLEQLLLHALVFKPCRLTGDEVRFIRTSLALTLQQFAARFNVSHPAVMKWERRGTRATAMDWATEKDIRLELLHRAHVKPASFVDAYGSLATAMPPGPQQLTALEVGTTLKPSAGRRRTNAAARG
ncbi:MAG: hypothetical protein HY815_18915 [Candidatus Riflebacteria bacterium]|nr:hypothetical protein [Candidatus Riflebacteria bacterium]